MEKATEVYNKLKLRFVGKGEMAAKPGGENKDQEDNGEMKNTGSNRTNSAVLLPALSPRCLQVSSQICLLFYCI